MVKITGTNTYIDVELDGRTAKSLVFASAKMRPLKSLIAENIEKLQKGEK